MAIPYARFATVAKRPGKPVRVTVYMNRADNPPKS
jgi:hypothetical protein